MKVEIFGFIFVIVAILGGASVISSVKCLSKAEAMSREWKWGPVSGCLIQTNQGFVPLEQFRVME